MDNLDIAGFLLIDKPAGITSHGVISRLRRIAKIKKIGHAGTLDPFATGLLIVAIGRKATREIGRYVKHDKEYVADIYLGVETDTYDKDGKVVKESSIEGLLENEVEGSVEKFIGKQQQLPPMYSAKKVNGKKLYELARKNIEIERKPSDIEIFDLEILKLSLPILKIRVRCSSGTYIRTLAYDIGKKLGCGAHLKELRRTKIGAFKVEDSVRLEDLNETNWQEKIFW